MVMGITMVKPQARKQNAGHKWTQTLGIGISHADLEWPHLELHLARTVNEFRNASNGP